MHGGWGETATYQGHQSNQAVSCAEAVVCILLHEWVVL